MDRGSFYCCIKGENNTNTEDTTGCQEFLLRVKGPTRATTGPVLTGTQWDPRSGSTRYTASRIAIVLPGLLWMSRTAL
ncbi:predicted protein [Nematostella vectensis]|uniref:Uncharacterized protein n=2 Tax=Nematostella vectensis TaxID=45351 RepID=A7SPS6_NEMVE|nr:predicted protein [Nematostella vectensis]|eukprot:XP_001626421.1 predicted protein [Nematostella vectensis]